MGLGLGLADMLAPGVGRPLLEVLKLICTAANEMHESNSLCTRAYEELAFIYTKLNAMEQKGTLPSDDLLRKYSRLVGDYSVFLEKHRGRAWLYRVVTYKRVLAKVSDIQADVAGLMRALHLCHMDAMADEISSMKQFREQQRAFRKTQQRVIEAHLTDDATVAKEVARKEQQVEALSVFRHELETAGASETAAEQHVLRTALNKVMRRSSVQVKSVPEWFLPPHKVEYESQAFARGSFGTVHHGKMRGDVAVVVKCLLLGNVSTNERHMRQFRKEATLWYSFRHKHVLTMYGACDVSSPPFLVCEYASNSNLCNFLSTERHRAFTFQLLREAASGLLYLHEHRVVHADLKCDNILVTADGTAKVADFSFSYVRTLSASKQSLGDTSGMIKAGAVRWRAPECLRGRPPTARSDIYSLGMCIIEAVSQDVPWGYVDDDTVRDLVKSAELPDKPEDMTDRVWTLVQRMCSFNPTDRPTLETVVEELGRLASEEAAVRGPGLILGGTVPLSFSSSFSFEPPEPDTAYDSVTATDSDECTSDPTEPAVTTPPRKASSKSSDASSYAAARDSNVPPPSAQWATYTAPPPSPPSRPPPPSYDTLTLEQVIVRDDVKCIDDLLPTAYALEKSIDVWGSTPLILAAAAGATKVTKHLLSRSANVYATTAADRDFRGLADRSCTALHIAAHFGHTHVTRALLAAKSNLVGLLTLSKRSALFFAVRSGHAVIVRELLKSGADCKICDVGTGATALAVAIDCGQVDCVRMLIKCKADVIALGSNRATALHRAAELGHDTIVSELLRYGARLDERDANGCTPLHVAVQKDKEGCVRALLEAKADPNCKTADGATALHDAAEQGQAQIVSALLQHGARVDEPNSHGDTPLIVAAKYGKLNAARVLLENKADVHAKSVSGTTALHQAAGHGHVDMVIELVRQGARVNEPSLNGNTPLYWAAWRSQGKTARVLLAHKADVDMENSDGMTALHRAASQGSSDLVKLLLDAGATVDRKAVKLSQRNGHADLVKLLKSKVPSVLTRLFSGGE